MNRPRVVHRNAKDEDPFALFAGTITFFLNLGFVNVQVHIDGKKEQFFYSRYFRDRQGGVLDRDHKLLLRDVILENPNVLSIERCEGGVNVHRANGCAQVTDHFHVNFRNYSSDSINPFFSIFSCQSHCIDFSYAFRSNTFEY